MKMMDKENTCKISKGYNFDEVIDFNSYEIIRYKS